MWISSFSPAPFVEEAVFPPMYVLDFFVKNQIAVAVWVCIWVYYFLSLVFMSVFVPVPRCFIVVALSHSLKSVIVIPPVLLTFLSIALAIQAFVLLCEF
jgi:hypothetical protein